MTDLQTGPRGPGRLQGRGRLRRLQLRRHAGRRHRLGAQHHLQPEAGGAVPGLLRPHRHLRPGRVQRLPDVRRAGRHHPRRARPGRASPPTRASASRRACRWSKCSIRPACSSPAWPAAACRSRWRTARATPTSSTAATRPRRSRAMRFVDNHGAADRALSVQPERQRRRPDRGDHRRRPLHRADAAPGARVPQHPDELDLGRQERVQSPWMRIWRNARKWVG